MQHATSRFHVFASNRWQNDEDCCIGKGSSHFNSTTSYVRGSGTSQFHSSKFAFFLWRVSTWVQFFGTPNTSKWLIKYKTQYNYKCWRLEWLGFWQPILTHTRTTYDVGTIAMRTESKNRKYGHFSFMRHEGCHIYLRKGQADDTLRHFFLISQVVHPTIAIPEKYWSSRSFVTV